MRIGQVCRSTFILFFENLKALRSFLSIREVSKGGSISYLIRIQTYLKWIWIE